MSLEDFVAFQSRGPSRGMVRDDSITAKSLGEQELRYAYINRYECFANLALYVYSAVGWDCFEVGLPERCPHNILGVHRPLSLFPLISRLVRPWSSSSSPTPRQVSL